MFFVSKLAAKQKRGLHSTRLFYVFCSLKMDELSESGFTLHSISGLHLEGEVEAVSPDTSPIITSHPLYCSPSITFLPFSSLHSFCFLLVSPSCLQGEAERAAKNNHIHLSLPLLYHIQYGSSTLTLPSVLSEPRVRSQVQLPVSVCT